MARVTIEVSSPLGNISAEVAGEDVFTYGGSYAGGESVPSLINTATLMILRAYGEQPVEVPAVNRWTMPDE